MSYRSELNSYIAQLRQRLRLEAGLRGAAVFICTALVVTVALVLVLNQFAFPVHAIPFARLLILAALAAAGVFGMALPIVRRTEAWAARHAEAANPELEQRLTTFEERLRRGDDPFLELLAADTLARTKDAEPAIIVPDNQLIALGAGGLACLGMLVWMIAAGPGYLGYGANLLWTGQKKNAAPFYSILIKPGNVTVRRNGDQLITAQITGMQSSNARLFAHYQSSTGWEPVAMQRTPDAAGGVTYQFVLAGLPENVEYYVDAGPLASPHYKIRVVDLPSVKDVHVTYQYPGWTGMKPVTEEHSGDLRAIEGTDATIQVQTSSPLKDGQLALDDGQTIHLKAGQENTYEGTLHMEKDGAYHLAATDEGQLVRLSEDYFIATDKAMPPEIAIARPGGDYRASPIEEVTVGVKGTDTFGLKEMQLHYSINGGVDHDVNLLKAPGAKTADSSYTLPLEDFKLAPGDLVSIYATAKDGHSEARTDISFIQVDPFEREFSQSQQSGSGGGGGGGNGGDQTEISKREKELIAATWKQQNDKAATAGGASAQGQFLSDAQQKLRDQVNALSARMQSRDISEANQEFTDFDKDMRAAAEAMVPCAEKLRGMQWKDAISLEQKALQALLRAEATFRQIQVAFGQQGSGGGGGNSGRDLASLFDLELDTAKNQYETAQTTTPAEQHEKDVEDTLAKLDALTKRQEELAHRQQNPQQSFQERWEQEMLRREAEQLQRQMQQLAQDGQQGRAQSDQQSGRSSEQQNSSSQSLSSGWSGSVSSPQQAPGTSHAQSSDQRIEQALSRMQQATGAMKRGDNQGQNNNAQQAAQQLRQASNLLSGTQQQLASGKLDSLTREADRLRQEERAQASQIRRFASQQNDTAPDTNDLETLQARRRQLTQLTQDRQQLSDGLSSLERDLRDAAREIASNEPGPAKNLRDTLKEMDDLDLDNRVQRTADWLRRGINPDSDGTEDQIAQGLAKLSQQLKQAQKGVEEANKGQQRGTGQDGAGQDRNEQDRADLIDQVERLRNQIESMMRSKNGRGDARQDRQSDQSDQAGKGGRSGGQSFAEGERLSRDGQPSRQPGGQDQQMQSAANGARSSEDVGNRSTGALGGDVRNRAGQAEAGTAWNNINTGNNRYGDPRRQPGSAEESFDSAEGNYRQSLRELNQMRQVVKGQPQEAKEIEDLTRQMQYLDPKRFPGNPAMVEQMRQEMLSSVNRLELQLQNDDVSSDARTGNPLDIPTGYQDSVADYFRRLSKNP